MTRHLGDYRKNDVVHTKWTTNGQDGASITYTGGTFHAYKNDDTGTEVTVGITVTKDFDGVTGVHHLKVDTSADALYANGNEYCIVGKSLTIDTKTVSTVVAQFSLRNRKGIIDELMATVVDGSYTVKQWLTLIGAVLFGTTGSSGTSFKKQNGTAAVDVTFSGNNRSTMTLNP